MAIVLLPEEVRAYLSDYPEENLLLDKEEFSDTSITLAMELALSDFNSIPPRSGFGQVNFPSKGVLLYGTLWHLFLGRAALLARNHLTYSDGGLQVPVEERYELYISMANTFQAMYKDAASKLKISMNMEAGWGSVSSDEAYFPLW